VDFVVVFALKHCLSGHLMRGASTICLIFFRFALRSDSPNYCNKRMGAEVATLDQFALRDDADESSTEAQTNLYVLN